MTSQRRRHVQTDPILLHARAGMTVIVEDGNDLRMADVDTGVINWFNAHPVTRMVPRV